MAEIRIERASPFILLSSVLNKPGVGANICETLASKNINIESFIVISVPGKDRTDILIGVAEEDLPEATHFLSQIAKDIEAKGLLFPSLYVEDLVTLVIQGIGLQKQTGIAARLMGIFYNYNVNVWAFIATSIEEKAEINVLLERKRLDEHPEIIEEIKKVV